MTTTDTYPAIITTYLKQLAQGLRPLPADEREDVLRELRTHLDDGLAAGQSPDALLAGMGPAREVAEALVSERLVAVDQRRTPSAIAWMVAKAAGIPALVAFALMMLLMMVNTLYLYAELMASSRAGWGTWALMQLYNMPAIVVLLLPVMALMAGLAGLPKLATLLSAPTMARLYPRLAAGGMVLAALLAWGGYQLNDTLVPLTNRLTVDGVRVFVLNEAPQADDERSPQELDLAAVDRRLAALHAERDRLAASGAPYQDIAKRDQALRGIEVDRHLKLALPAYSLPLMAFGLAMGTLLARRRPLPAWVHVGVAIATIVAIYVAMSAGRHSDAFSGAPWLAAWAPLLLPATAAAAVWVYARIARRGIYADV